VILSQQVSILKQNIVDKCISQKLKQLVLDKIRL
jgi:hypothetical protein